MDDGSPRLAHLLGIHPPLQLQLSLPHKSFTCSVDTSIGIDLGKSSTLFRRENFQASRAEEGPRAELLACITASAPYL